MRRSRPPFRCLIGLVLVLCIAAPAASGEQLLVSAAASLTDVLQEIRTVFQRENPVVEITHNVGGSGTLQKQIENGAPADLFLAAAVEPMDALEKQNLLHAGSRTDLLTNTLVLITSKDRQDIQSFADLAGKHVKYIAIGEPRSVPVGLYAVECLTKQRLMPQVEAKLVRLLNARQVLAAVGTGNADAGMVYRTDAETSGKVRTVAVAPPGSHRPIIYSAAIIRRSRNLEAAQRYLTFLKSETAHALFEKHGFTVVP